MGFLNLVRVLDDLRPPRRQCPGRPRRVEPADHEQVTDWMQAFGVEAGLHVLPSRDAIVASLREDGAPPLLLWEAT